MSERLVELRAVLVELRRRWTRRSALAAWALGSATATVILLTGLLAVTLIAVSGLPLVLTTGVVSAIAIGALARTLWPLRHQPTDLQFARYIEERLGGLDDVLVTAVATAERDERPRPMLDLLAADALRALEAVNLDEVLPRQTVRQAAWRAAAGTAALVVTVALFAPALGRSASVAAAYLFPARITIEVTPGTAKVRAGDPVTIAARVLGVEGGLVPALTVGEGDAARTVTMVPASEAGSFELTLEEVTASIAYKVSAGSTESPDYLLTVIRPPRVERIDLRFEYPDGLGLTPREEEDTGDIYAPAGTRVHVTVTADKPIASGHLTLDDGTTIPLDGSSQVLGAGLRVEDNGSYRIALADTDGLENPGDTEYFIRTLLDRPPHVRILRPGGDRPVMPLEEVAIEARADDDFGVRSLDLVFQTAGGDERTVRIAGASEGLTATGSHTIYLEDLGVAPGDFVTYYARATDIGRGRQSSEARSDIFFLEIKPFEEEFVALQSQAMAMGGGNQRGLQDLAESQKAIIVATWNLDARARRARQRGSEDDIRAVGKAQAELQARAEEASGQIERSLRGGRRRRGPQPGGGLEPRGGDPLGLAAEAMGKAVTELDTLDTAKALPHEMEALNQILKADAEVRRRQVARGQQAGGGGSGNSGPDLSTLFDQELRKEQETNYETPNRTETQESQTEQSDPLERIRELARRQEALNRQQQDLQRNREQLAEEELKRRLERLTRDQTKLREEAEQLARQIEEQARQSGRASNESESSQGQQGQSESERMRQVSEEMRNAATELGRRATARASERGDRALERLRELEQQMQAARPDQRRRALGDLQLETQQLADAQRRLANEAARTAPDSPGDDARRRLAGEQERLAERTERVEEAVRRMAEGSAAGSSAAEPDARQAMDDAARQLEQQQLAERMRETAETLRQGPGASDEREPGSAGSPAGEAGRAAAREGEDMARSLEGIAERLGAATGQRTAESQRLSEQLSRTAELREQLNDLQRMAENLQREGQSPGQDGEPAGEPSEGQGAQGGQQPGQSGQQSGGQAGQEAQAGTGEQGGASGRPGGAGGGSGAIQRLQREMGDRMREAEQLAQEIRRDNPGMGGTQPDSWWPSTSAPGTEAFKQDFARWESLKENLLVALEGVESQLSDELRERENEERLNAGRHEAAPESYRELVEQYYRSLAAPRKPPQ